LNFLETQAAQLRPHVNGSLLEHLQGTCRLLHEWGNPDDICTAGLAHAVYGTAGFPPMLLDVTSDRQKLIDMIGQQAEALVYLYASCDREYVYPQLGMGTPVRFRDRFTSRIFEPAPGLLTALVEITFANELEMVCAEPSHAPHFRHAYQSLFERCRSMVSAGGIACFDRVCGGLPSSVA
jgi:hypothetical protein